MILKFCNIISVLLVSMVLLCMSAEARTKKRTSPAPVEHAMCRTQLVSGDIVPCIKSPPTSLILDYKTGKVLHSESPNAKIYPASLTKIMTLYLAFDALKRGKLSMEQKLTMSARAVNMPPCKLGLQVGEKITVREAVLAAIVKSANDAAVTLAEAISGSEGKFATLMTKKAHSLGMKNTIFKNASGWYEHGQHTTAIDLAKLAMAIRRDFPEYYGLFTSTQFAFRGRVMHGHNRVTKHYAGAEGMKTGFNNPSGANLITTASKNGKVLVGVVTGRRSGRARDIEMVSLLDKHFGVQSSAEQFIQKIDGRCHKSNVKSAKVKGGGVKKKHTTLALNKKKVKRAV